MGGNSHVRLDRGETTLVLTSRDDGPLALDFWGPRLPGGVDLRLVAGGAERVTPHGMLDRGETLDLIPETGRGFAGRPALLVSWADGRFITQMRLMSVSPRAGSLVAMLEDKSGLRIVQTLTLHESGVVRFDARLINSGAQCCTILRFASAALPCPFDEALRFGGRWTAEFAVERVRLGYGSVVSENRTGRTSHHAPPFLVVGDRGFGDDHGRVMGVHLGWSSDCDVLWERLRDGRAQVQMSALLGPGEVVLEPGEAYEAPPLFAARSEAGLNGLSVKFHAFVRAVVLDGRLQGRARPVHFNTWEALYFDHEPARLGALVSLASQVGVERFVLDDGWFLGRRNDGAGLGDWRADPQHYPSGLSAIADQVRAAGMEFGLWVEPECANPSSDVLRENPYWGRGETGRAEPQGRKQVILDLTRSDVFEAVFGSIDKAVRESGATLLKWDFNRDASHAASAGAASGVRQMHAVYGLIDRLRRSHPGLEIEACASGGARADYAMLSRCERIWLSDCNDPFDRQRQQRTFQVFFPPEVMGAHIGPETSHTTGRRSRLDTRALTAMAGHFGLELDLASFSDAEMQAVKAYVDLYKVLRGELHGGRVWRLNHPDKGVVASCVGSNLGMLSFVAQVDTSAFATPAPLRFSMLDREAPYEITLITPQKAPAASMVAPPAWASGAARLLLGAALMAEGLSLPVMRPGDVLLFRIRKLD